jgi:4-amino-4-deoxy-L-arabinose transferase-like glycosyltransferase
VTLRYRRPGAEGFDRAFWLLAALALVVIGAGLGLRDPWPVDEPRFALIARDMVLTGRWFFPHVAGVLYPDKPPLFMWTIAAFYWLTGSLRFSFLLPSLLSGLGCLWLVFDLGRKLFNRRVGLMAAAALLVTLQFTLLAKRAQIDAYECLWTTLALYGVLRHLLRGPAWGWYWAGFFAMGLGIITKGVGFLPLLVFIPWGAARLARWPLPRLDGTIRRWVLGPVALLVGVGIWLVPMLMLVALSHNPALAAYRDNILFHQTAGRYANAWHHFHGWWFYLFPVITIFWLPFSAALPWLVPAWWRRMKRRDARYLLLLGWIVLVVAFFSLSAGKRQVYILPAVPALALAVAPLLAGLVRLKMARLTALSITVAAGAFLGVSLIYYLAVSPDAGARLATEFNVHPWGFIGALMGAAWLAALVGRVRHGAHALAAFFLSIWIIYGFYGYGLINPDRSTKALMRRVDAHLQHDDSLAIIAWRPRFVLEAGRPIVHFGFRREGSESEIADGLAWLVRGPGRWLMIKGEDIGQSCASRVRAVDVGIRSGTRWYLVNRRMLDAACRAGAIAQAAPDTVYHSVPPPGWRQNG